MKLNHCAWKWCQKWCTFLVSKSYKLDSLILGPPSLMYSFCSLYRHWHVSLTHAQGWSTYWNTIIMIKSYSTIAKSFLAQGSHLARCEGVQFRRILLDHAGKSKKSNKMRTYFSVRSYLSRDGWGNYCCPILNFHPKVIWLCKNTLQTVQSKGFLNRM